MNTLWAVMVAVGMLAGGGLFAVVGGAWPDHPRLSAVFARLDAATTTAVSDPASRWERVGLRLSRRLGAKDRQLLDLLDIPIQRFYGRKVAGATIGALVPSLVAATTTLWGTAVAVPGIAVVIGCVIGWFWPTLVLRARASTVRADMREALFVFFDLVTLERLANASASQALYSAASISDVPLFRKLRAALDRARLDHQPPHLELRELADDLDLPPLADIADVIRLDEQGAALADVLRARVRELRDEHLTSDKIAASEVSERMTVWMTLPVLVFSLVFLTPALLRLIG